MWPSQFLGRIVLVPDFSAYHSTGFEDTFGYDWDLFLGGWQIEDTFFDYHIPDYDTNFGIKGTTSKGFPELNFNFVLKRNYADALFLNFGPLLTILFILFCVLLSITPDKKENKPPSFNILVIVGVCMALFSVIVNFHLKLREKLPFHHRFKILSWLGWIRCQKM